MYFQELVIKMEQSTFRQTEDRHVSVEVTSMLWSPKMDLIALANLQGEVNIKKKIHFSKFKILKNSCYHFNEMY